MYHDVPYPYAYLLCKFDIVNTKVFYIINLYTVATYSGMLTMSNIGKRKLTSMNQT